MAKPRPRLFVMNDPYPMRISSELAMEIGFNESILLLQLEYLISISTTEEIEGRIWTRQSLEELHEYFPFWSLAKISRTIKSLEEQQLIIIGSFNRAGYDRTQWFALNEEGIANLKSIQINEVIFQNEKCKRSKCKMDDSKMQNASVQNEKPILQNETTIPETPTEIPSETPTETSSSSSSAPSTGEEQEEEAGQLSEDLQAYLLEMGVFKNLFPELKKLASERDLYAIMDWVSEENEQTPKSIPKLFLFRCRNHLTPPEVYYGEACPVCGRFVHSENCCRKPKRYYEGELSEFVEH